MKPWTLDAEAEQTEFPLKFVSQTEPAPVQPLNRLGPGDDGPVVLHPRLFDLLLLRRVDAELIEEDDQVLRCQSGYKRGSASTVQCGFGLSLLQRIRRRRLRKDAQTVQPP